MKTIGDSEMPLEHRPRGFSSRDGAVLVIVMLVSGIMLMSVMSMMLLAGNASHRMRRMTLNAKALSIAEAGIADMIGRLTTNYWHWQDSTNSLQFADGWFYVVSRTNQGGNVIITSTGRVQDVSRVTSVELLGTERDRNDLLFSLDGAILSGGDVRFRTAAFTIRGNVHSNQEITSTSGAHQGDFLPASNATEVVISAVGDIDPDLDGFHETGVEARELPQFDFESYRQMTCPNEGSRIEGDLDERHWDPPVPSNGVIYVNGNVIISGNTSLQGISLVVNGDITLENNYSQQDVPDGMPALLSTGNIYLANRGRLEGLVYSQLNVYIQNNVDIDGGIISGGYTEVNNKTEVTHPSDYPDWDPLQPDIPPEVIVGGWLR